MLTLARCFAVEIDAYAVMSNHFHLVVHYDPIACEGWSAEEVAARWVDAFPPTERGTVVQERKPEVRELMLGDPERLERARKTLGSLSSFMKHLRITRQTDTWRGTSTHCLHLIFSAVKESHLSFLPSAVTTNLQLPAVAFRAATPRGPGGSSVLRRSERSTLTLA